MKNKNNFLILVLALVVGSLGIASVSRVLAQSPTTDTTVSNSTSVITGGPTDNGSNGTTPTNAGSNVIFNVTATDANGDNFYFAVCKTNAITAVNSGAPTCDGGSWAISASTPEATQATATYTTAALDSESNVWYGFVCDFNVASTCSIADQGDSPFEVNHAGAFGTVTVTDSSLGDLQPGETALFTLASADMTDGDTSNAQDDLTMFVCSGEASMGGVTTGFVVSTSTCTNGTLLCSSNAVNPTTTSATCSDSTDFVSIPTAADTFDTKIYVRDSHNFLATGTNLQSNVPVTDVVPVLVSYDTSDTITMVAGGSDTLTYKVSFTDNNGDGSPTSLDMVFFLDTLTDGCTGDENDCYPISSIDTTNLAASGCTSTTISTPGAAGTKTATGTDNAATISCDDTIYFNASDGNWEYSASLTDGNGVTNFADTAVNEVISALTGISVAEGSLSYGTLSPGGTSAFSASTVSTVQNQGNTLFDIGVSVSDMTSGGDTILSANQHLENSGLDFTYGTGDNSAVVTALTGPLKDAADGCLNSDVPVRNVSTSGASSDKAIGWKLQVGGSQPSGSYTGTTSFASTTACGGPTY